MSLGSVWGVVFPGGSDSEESTCNAEDAGRCGLKHWGGKTPWRRAWQPTPVFLPGESHGQKSLVGYSLQDYKELDMTEVTEPA